MNSESNDEPWADILAALVEGDAELAALDDEDGPLSRDIIMAQYNSMLDFQTNYSSRDLGQSSNTGEIRPFDGSATQPSQPRAPTYSTIAPSSRYRDRLNLMAGNRSKESKPAVGHVRVDLQLREIQTSGLCFACSNIKLENHYPSTHHALPSLGFSATKGCPMCKFLLKNFSGKESNRSAEVTVDLKSSTLRYRVPNDGGGSQTIFELLRWTGAQSSQSGHAQRGTFRHIQPDAMSNKSLELIRTWLSNCHSTHRFCTRDLKFPLPTRLIDVSGPEPCLREFESTNVPYVALSHCWGDKATLISSKSTRSNHMKGIPTSSLPRTFQDAVTVTKKLGISYLWIDSLCIIQDSMEDWIAECPKMRAYYRNAYITISALESPDSQHGFLTPREVADEVPFPNETGVWIRPQLLDRGKIFQKACLNHRGWALQERLLSTCVLHFTHQEMFWECQTHSVRESSAVESHGSTDFQSLVLSEGEDFKRALYSVGPDRFAHQDGVFALWMRLVRQFSRRSCQLEQIGVQKHRFDQYLDI